MDKCSFCGAECRPGDNFCLNCGNRLLPAMDSTQGTPKPGQLVDLFFVQEALTSTCPRCNGAVKPNEAFCMHCGTPLAAQAPLRPAVSASMDKIDKPAPDNTFARNMLARVSASMDKIDKPSRLILRDDNGNLLDEYVLEKPETTIGRGPNRDILVSKDKLTSRWHASLRYENGNYFLYDERSANGTFVNGRQLEDGSRILLHDGDHIGIGEHEFIFRAFEQALQAEQPIPALPRMFVSHSSKDNEFGAKLVQDLRHIVGDEDAVWYDASGGLHGGDAWWRKIRTELKARSVFIVVLSPDSMTSPWVNDEIDLAWRQKNTRAGMRIIPVLYRECEVREDLYLHQIISFLQPKSYEIAFNELLKALGLPNKRM